VRTGVIRVGSNAVYAVVDTGDTSTTGAYIPQPDGNGGWLLLRTNGYLCLVASKAPYVGDLANTAHLAVDLLFEAGNAGFERLDLHDPSSQAALAIASAALSLGA
jgi:hypothetical protein